MIQQLLTNESICCILLLLSIITSITALIDDRVNCVLCIIMGAISMLFVHKISSLDFLTAKGETMEEARSNLVLIWTTIFGATMLLRFFPCLNMEAEKRTYLVLGTLIEDTENHVVSISTFFLIPAIFTTSFYLISKQLVSTGWYYIGYIAIGVFLLLSAVGFVRSFFE